MTLLCEQRVGDEVVFRVSRDNCTLIADFVGVGRLRADTRNSTHSFVPDDDADPTSVAKVLEGAVPALLRHLQGRLTLHGSSATLRGRALICIGPSGSGKSTAVAELVTRPGFEFVSDDSAAIDVASGEVQIVQTEPSIWLFPSSRRALGLDATDQKKTRVQARAVHTGAASLVAICGLTFGEAGEAPRLRRLRGSEAFAAIAGCVFRFAVDDPASRVRELDQLVNVCKLVHVYEVRRPRSLETLALTGHLLQSLLDEERTT
jgi:hypothetical protein